MSKLTEAQILKLYGRKKPFVPSHYRIKIQNELGLAIRRTQAGEMSVSQLKMVAGKAKPVKAPLQPKAKLSPQISPVTGKPIAEMTLPELSREFDFRRYGPLLEQLERDQRGQVKQFPKYRTKYGEWKYK